MAEHLNVRWNDCLKIPSAIKDLPPVTIRWLQDTVTRCATYCVCYGYNIASDRSNREVLVFVATEMVSEAYNWNFDHLSRTDLWLSEGRSMFSEAFCTLY